MRRIFNQHDENINKLDDGISKIFYIGLCGDHTRFFSSEMKDEEVKALFQSAVLNLAKGFIDRGEEKEFVIDFLCRAFADALAVAINRENK